MATKKYPPRDEEGLLAAGKQFEDGIGDPTQVGLTAGDITRLANANTAGQTAYDTQKDLDIQLRAATREKETALDLIDDILSEFNGRTQKHPGMTDELRAKLGIPIYDTVKTKAPAPTETPDVSINTKTPLRHEIDFSNKPEGVREIEIHLKIGGDATGNESDYQYKGRDTAPPYTQSFIAADSGKQAHYLFCWLNASGERGPWKMASATITSELQSITN
jgi:hypothetical protein